jgi:hypothetical protein
MTSDLADRMVGWLFWFALGMVLGWLVSERLL